MLDPCSVLVVPRTPRRPDEHGVNKRTHDCERLIESVRGGKQRTVRLGGVARLPKRTVRNIERLWQDNAAPLSLRRNRPDLLLRVNGRPLSYGNKIYQVAKSSRRSLRRAVALHGRRNLVSDVIDQRIGAIPALRDVGHVDLCERRNLVWFTEHVEIGADKIHAELCPHCLPDKCRDVEAHSGDPLSDRAAWPDLEAKPITDVACCRLTKICLGGVHALGSVDIDVNGCPYAEVPC